jgi:hypothetical protein
MARSNADLRAVPEGGVLFTLPNGIRILRRRKHEPVTNLLGLSRAALTRLTGKMNGSKFLPGTTLDRIVEMTTEVLLENQAAPGSNTSYNKVFAEPIGISAGRLVRALRIQRSWNGTVAHGYPVNENDL